MSMDNKVVTLEDLKAAQMLSVNPDWEQDDPTAPDYIKNKPESGLPVVTSSDEGKFLRVSSTGEWEAENASMTTPRVTMTSSDTTAELQPNTLYVFPEMASLTITLATPSDATIANEYHFIFTSGATATTLTIPASINHPDYFTIDSNMVYEISILENNMLTSSWAVGL